MLVFVPQLCINASVHKWCFEKLCFKKKITYKLMLTKKSLLKHYHFISWRKRCLMSNVDNQLDSHFALNALFY